MHIFPYLVCKHYFAITYTLTPWCPGRSEITHIQNIAPHIEHVFIYILFLMLCVQHYFTITYTLTLQCPGQSVINHIQNMCPHILIHIVSFIVCITSFDSNIYTYTVVSSGMKYIQNKFLCMSCVYTRGSLLQVSSRKTFHSNIHSYTAVSSVMK